MNTTIELKVKTAEGSEKTYSVQFPNNGQIIDISVMRGRLSSGQYAEMEFAAAYDPLVKRAKDLIDMMCVFSVLIPDLKKDINVKSFVELNREATDILLDVYRTQFLPWYSEWLKTLSSPEKIEERNDTNP